MQDTTQMLPVCPDTHPEHEGIQQSGQNEGGWDWLEDAGPGSPQATDWEGRASGWDAPSLPLSAASHRPDGINTRFLPLISSRGAGGDRGGEKKNSLERKTHFLRQKKKIKSGFIKVNFTGERRERAKHNVLEISSAWLCPRKQDKAASAVSAGVHWGEWGRGVWLQAVEVGANLLENLLHGALGIELGTEGLAGGLARELSSESNWSSSKDAFWPWVKRPGLI